MEIDEELEQNMRVVTISFKDAVDSLLELD